MNWNKVLFGCLFATLLVGPLGHVYGRGGHGGGGRHHASGGHAGIRHGGHYSGVRYGGHYAGGYHGAHGWNHGGWGWGLGLGWGLGWWWGWNGWASPYYIPVENTVYIQQVASSSCSVTPDDVYQMTGDVAAVMRSNPPEVVRSVGEQYKAEYNAYIQMLQNSDPVAADQACKLQGIYESFMNVYQQYQQSMPSTGGSGGYMRQQGPAGGSYMRQPMQRSMQQPVSNGFGY